MPMFSADRRRDEHDPRPVRSGAAGRPSNGIERIEHWLLHGIERGMALAGLCCALVATGVVSCAGTEVGNPGDKDATGTIEFTARADHAAGALTLDSGVEITEAWFALDEVRIDGVERCIDDTDPPNEDDPDDMLTRRAFVEVVAGVELPMPVEFREMPGEFCRLRMRYDATDNPTELPVGAPAALDGVTLLVRGFTPSGVPFEVRASDEFDVELDAPSEMPFSLEAGQHRLFVAFAMNTWFADLDLDALADEQGGDMLVIDDASEGDALDTFEDALATSPRLYRDANLDGVLDMSELVETLAD